MMRMRISWLTVFIFILSLVGGQADVFAAFIYWTAPDAGAIRRARLDGSGVEDVVTGLDRPVGIAFDPQNGKLYWTDSVIDTIKRANLDGTAVEDVITLGGFALALDIVDETLYVGAQHSLDKVSALDERGRGDPGAAPGPTGHVGRIEQRLPQTSGDAGEVGNRGYLV